MKRVEQDDWVALVVMTPVLEPGVARELPLKLQPRDMERLMVVMDPEMLRFMVTELWTPSLVEVPVELRLREVPEQVVVLYG